MGERESHPELLQRHFGLLQATTINFLLIVGVGVFVTIPLMLKELPGPYAVLGWVVAGVLVLLDSLVWSELGTMMPSSGGTYRFLLEGYGSQRAGRLFAFLYIWQFLLSGPLELASGLIAIDTFVQSLLPGFKDFNNAHKFAFDLWKDQSLSLTFSPGRGVSLGLGLLLIYLLLRDVRGLSRLTLGLGVGVVAVMVWIGLEGAIHYDSAKVFDMTGREADVPRGLNFAMALGKCAILAFYSYMGYYNVCFIGDEVRSPDKTIPRSIFLSAILAILAFVGLHLAMLGVVSWKSVPTDPAQIEEYSLAAEVMKTIHGGTWAASLVTVLLIWSGFAAAFSGLLGGSRRVPYGAARRGHFFAVFGRVHPTLRIPHVAVFFVGILMLFFVFFDLANVITALITVRILEQFMAQIVGLMVLRRTHPEWPRPFRIWLYPVPCGLALACWLFMYFSADWTFVILGVVVLLAGLVSFFSWTYMTKQWPFGQPPDLPTKLA